MCTLLSQSCVASRTQYTEHKVAQFESFVKVFVPGGREGGKEEDGWLRNMTGQNRRSYNAWARKVDVTMLMKVFAKT